jgi:tetratricopeptide (TPR) repeat protein
MMSGNKSEWSDSQRNLALHIAAMQSEILGKKTDAAPVLKEEKTEEKVTDYERLHAGKRLFHMSRWENALKEFQLVGIEKIDASEQAELAYYLGLCYTKLERYDEAVPYIEQVVTVDRNPLRSYQCRITLALIYIKTNRAKMAEFELKRLKNAGFESASMYNAMAYSAYIQKRYRQAVDYYEKALELDINNATAMNSMGFILVDRGFDAIKGLMLCRKAVDLRPQNAAYMDSLGWACYKCGDVAEARSWLQKAIACAPKENEIQEHYRIVTGGAA